MDNYQETQKAQVTKIRTRTTQTSKLRQIDVVNDERRFSLSFSSEEPCDRTFGKEILDHSDDAVDLTRLNTIGCLLFNHDPDAVVGKIVRAWIENKRGCAVVEFDKDQRSEDIFQKVKNGSLKGVSVGYTVDDIEDVEEGMMNAIGVAGPAEIIHHWTPMEISIVSVPADGTVGVGRSIEFKGDSARLEQTKEQEKAPLPKPEEKRDESKQRAAEVKSIDLKVELEKERKRIAEISAMCRSFDMPAEDEQRFINDGLTIEQAGLAVIEKLKQTKKPLTARASSGENIGEEAFRRDAVDGLLLRGGFTVKDASDGAKQFSQLSFRDLAIECLERNEVNARRFSNDDLFAEVVRSAPPARTRQYFNPTAAFPAILDNAINKAYIEGHQTVPVTFDQWTKKGSLKDFKTYDNYYIAGPVGEFEEVPEGGELKHDLPRDAKRPTRRLKTFGKQFTMSRQAFINDDIDVVTRIPARYAAAARKTINTQCYEVLMSNPDIYDGQRLFSKQHGNLMAVASGVTSDSLQKMMLVLSTQLDEFGESVILRPAKLIVPLGIESQIHILFNSPTINTPDNTQAANPLYNLGLQVISDPTINAMAGGFGKVMPWWLLAAQEDTDFVEVDYLNGQEIPTIRRMETPGQLGFIWDIWLDWGISVMDYRGAIKNPGVVIASPMEP